MSNRFNADTLKAAILAAKSDDSIVDAIAKGTQGEVVAPEIIGEVKAALDAAGHSLNFVTNVTRWLEVAPHLTTMQNTAKALFADKANNPRKGSAYSAMLAARKGIIEGGSPDIAQMQSRMEKACPQLTVEQAAAARVASLAAQMIKLLPAANMGDMVAGLTTIQMSATAKKAAK